MRKKRQILLWLIFISALIFKTGCVDLPKDIVMPKWDVDLNVPIFSKTYTLWDAVKKDTSSLHTYTSGTNAGLLYYSDIKRINPVTVGDNLNVNQFSTSASAAISSIDIATPSAVTTTIYPKDIYSGIVYGSSNIFPAVSSITSSKEFTTSTQFTTIKLETGNLNLKITNNFPFTIVINKLAIKNSSDYSQLVNDGGIGDLTSGETYTLNYDISGKTIYQTIIVEATIQTNGSGSTPVTLTTGNNLSFTAQLQDYSLNYVNAALNANSFSISDTYQFDDSTYIQSAVIDKGSVSITANSSIDVALTAVLTIQSLKDASGNYFTQTINLSRKEKNKVITIPSLSNYTISDPSGGLVNIIQYTLNVTSEATSDYRTIYGTDNVSASINISDLYFKSVTGKIKPTNLTVDETSVDLGLGDLSDDLLVSQIDFENPSIQLKLNKSTDVKINFSGTLTGKSSTQTSTMEIPSTILGSGETTIALNSASVRTFIKSFSGKLPQTITVKGKAVINPSYETASIANTDSVYGTAEIEFPMKVAVTGGSLRDSSDVDLTDDDRTEMKKVTGGSLILEIQNGIAFDASISARVYDENNNFLMNLPPNRTPNDTLIHVQAATVNSSGKVSAATSSSVSFSLNQSEVELLTKSKYIISKISFYTSGNNGSTVEFKTSDAITIKAYGSLNYTVEESK